MKTRIIKTAPLAISPQKMNLVAGLIRRQSLDQASETLAFSSQKGGKILYKSVQGITKSLVKENQNPKNFYLSRIEVNQGPTLKRSIYRAKGRTDRISKRRSIIKLHLNLKENLKI